MAAPAELTPESLHDALRAILARGEYPSMAKVREELGTTASQQTLTKHMKKAWQGLADQMGSGLPEGLPRVVVDAAHRFYEEARGYANAELERQKAEMHERETALKAELESARQRVVVLDSQVEHLQQRAESAEAEVERLGEALDNSQQAHQDAEAQAQKLENTIRDERTRAAEQRQQLSAEHARRLKAVEKERDHCHAGWEREIERSDSQQETWAKQVDEARQELRAAQSKHDASEKRWSAELAKARRVMQERQDQLGVQQVEIQQISAERERAEEKLKEATHAIESLTARHDKQTESWQDSLANAQSEIDVLQQSLGQARGVAEERAQQITMLQSALERADRWRDSSS